MTGYVHSFESFGTVDGPGIRFVVFLQGCPLRCQYCHNPDTWKAGGTPYESDEVVAKMLRYKNYFGEEGGITVSGGEPMLQRKFVAEIFQKAHKEGVNTCLDTSGCVFDEKRPEEYEEVFKETDLVLLDIKHIDEEECKKLTGQSNKNTLALARYLSDNGKKMWIRHVLVPGLTDKDEYLQKIRQFTDTLKTVERIEVLPYHTMGVVKYEKLGYEYPLKGVQPPDKARVENAKNILGAGWQKRD